MDRRRFLEAAAFLSVGWPAAVSEAKPRTKRAVGVDAALCRDVTKVPAVAVAGMIDGQTAALASGVKNAETGGPVTVDTIFPAASLSKAVFALAVRGLARDGKLDLDRPLQDTVDLGLTGDARLITATHVLTHSTGLPNWRFQLDQPLVSDFKPGSRWRYSGEGFVLLQRVVEKITDTPIANYMKRAVLVPLGMASSTFAWTPEIESVAASGHDSSGAPHAKSLAFYARSNHEKLAKAGLSAETARYDEIVAAYKAAGAAPLPIAISPNVAGSLMTSAADYASFLKRVMADAGRYPDEFRPIVTVNRAISWTLGLGMDRTPGQPGLFQWGDGPGVKHLAWVRPERKTAVVFLTNGDRGASLYSWLFRQLLHGDSAALYWI